jgi:hypothetical protein
MGAKRGDMRNHVMDVLDREMTIAEAAELLPQYTLLQVKHQIINMANDGWLTKNGNQHSKRITYCRARTKLKAALMSKIWNSGFNLEGIA